MVRYQSNIKAIIDRVLAENNVKKYKCSIDEDNRVVVVLNIDKRKIPNIVKQIGVQGCEAKEVFFAPHANITLARKLKKFKANPRKGHVPYRGRNPYVVHSKQPSSISGIARIVVAPPHEPGPTPPLPDPNGTGAKRKRQIIEQYD